MAIQNSGNIPKGLEPYVRMSKAAKLAGGAEKYLQNTYNRGFEACKIIIQKPNTKKSVLSYGLAAMVSIGAWELGKFGLRKLNEYINKPVELKVHRILSQPGTATQTAAPESTAVTEAAKAEKPPIDTVKTLKTSADTSEAANDTLHEEEQPLVICEDDLEDQPPEWFAKMYEAMRLRNEEGK